MKIKGTQQISVHLPEELHKRLRLLSYETHKSQTKIIVEALVLYNEVVRRQRALAHRSDDGPAREKDTELKEVAND